MAEVCREEGVVVDVEGKDAVVRLLSEKREKCRGCGICSAGSLRTFRLPWRGRGHEAVGARVEVEIRRPNPALASFVLFGLPALFIGAGAIAGGVLSHRPGLAGWGWAIAGAAVVCGAVLWIWVVKRLERRWRRKGLLDARIVRVLAEGESGR